MLIQCRASTIGATGMAMTAPLLVPLEKENGDIFKPRYVCTSDSLIHVNIVVVSTVLTLDTIFTDTKKKVWFSGHIPMRTQTEGTVLQTHSQMQSCSAHGDHSYFAYLSVQYKVVFNTVLSNRGC